MSEVKLRETGWATMEPNCYGGPECDEIEPRWHTFFDGDKEAADIHEPLLLDARTFAPGTRIVIAEPFCPECGEGRSMKYPAPKTGPMFVSKCDCGFDWDQWVLEEYS